MKRIIFSICLCVLMASCGFDYNKADADVDSSSGSGVDSGGDNDSNRAIDSTDDSDTAVDTVSDSVNDSGSGSASEIDVDTGSGIEVDSGAVGDTDTLWDSDTIGSIDTGSESLSGNCMDDCRDLTWIHFDGGVFQMGSENGDVNEQPVHLVSVPAFDILETEVTVAQYDDCVQAGECPLRKDEVECTPNVPGFDHYPANCLSWDMAWAFCTWTGAALPTEAQWEYAARSGGKDHKWPWGNNELSCDRVVSNETKDNCNISGTLPVCSRTAGNTEQGLCDMSGNVSEWLLDYYLGTYDCDVVRVSGCPMSGNTQTPVDGSAYEGGTTYNGVRGGHYFSNEAYLTTTSRGSQWHQHQDNWLGVRCARWTTQ